MPRRNHSPRGLSKRRRRERLRGEAMLTRRYRAATWQDLAVDLVHRGKASPVILGPLPPPRPRPTDRSTTR